MTSSVLRIDPAAETDRIAHWIRETVFQRLRRRGAVVGVSGGIDSSVVAFLCARALGPERVRILLMPEAESSPESLRLGRMVAESLDVIATVEDITPILAASRSYQRRDDAVRLVAPEFGEGYKCKLLLPGLAAPSQYAVFSVAVQAPGGAETRIRLSPNAYLGIVAATNFKQRVRKMLEYHYADLLQFVVAGTPNRLEYDLGFFVKLGDGAADFNPIAHLYKCQVYQLAEYLGVPHEIRTRPPTTDTYPLEQSQEEFYFRLPLDQLDLSLYAYDHAVSAGELAVALGIPEEQAVRIYRMIESNRKMAQYLHAGPVVMDQLKTEAHAG